MTRHFYIKILFLLCFVQLGYSQFDIPKKPTMQTSLYDYANVLSAQEKQALEQKLINYSDSTSTQIVVITTPTIKGESIGILAPKWAQEWGIGQAKEDNGILILLALQERKIWIAPGYGVEDRLTAGVNGELIRNVILPNFKSNNYYAGLDQGADAIFDVLNGKYKGTRKANKEKSLPLLPFIIIIVIIIFIISKNKNNGRGGGNSGNRGGGFDLADMIILGSLGRGLGGGGGFGGSSGGGFGGGGFGGGFGGGGFSGGGAGGSW